MNFFLLFWDTAPWRLCILHSWPGLGFSTFRDEGASEVKFISGVETHQIVAIRSHFRMFVCIFLVILLIPGIRSGQGLQVKSGQAWFIHNIYETRGETAKRMAMNVNCDLQVLL